MLNEIPPLLRGYGASVERASINMALAEKALHARLLRLESRAKRLKPARPRL